MDCALISCVVQDATMELEPQHANRSTDNVSITAAGSSKSKRVMATPEEDRPARLTRQRTRELGTTPSVCIEPATTAQDGSSEDALLAADDQVESIVGE